MNVMIETEIKEQSMISKNKKHLIFISDSFVI